MDRTPFFALGVAEGDATTGVGSTGTSRTALSAGLFCLKSSSAPGKLALRVIVRLLVQLTHAQDVGMTLRLLKMMHNL
jgi:hypothetical protein